MNLKGVKFAFLSHETEGATGYPEMLGNYLRECGAKLSHIRFPFFISQTKSIWIEQYDGPTLLSKKRSWIRFYQPQVLSFLKDFLWTLTYGWTQIRGADLLITSNNLNAMAGVILRELGIVKRVVFMMIDYSPKRFDNPVIEAIYRWVDRFAAVHADSCWPIAKSMLDGRVERGTVKYEEVDFCEAPMGTYSHVIFKDGPIAYDKRDLIYVGNPNAKNVRADFLLDMAAYLRDRGEKFRLIFVGPGSSENLQKKAKDLNLDGYVVFRGSVADIIDLEKLCATCGIGLAPYDPYLEGNFSRFADPGKIKNYLGCGLPVVSTVVPPIAKEIEERGAGFMADMTPEEFSAKILKLWNDEALYVNARKQARVMGDEYAWPVIFDRLLEHEGFGSRRTSSSAGGPS